MEEPLPAGGSCLLGAINLSVFVKDPFTDHAEFDFEEFKKVVRKAVFALNDVLLEGMPLHPLAEQRDTVGRFRQIGLGINNNLCINETSLTNEIIKSKKYFRKVK